MNKIYTQIIHNLKKDKGSFVSFGLIILATSFMLNLALVLLFQVDKAYDTKFDALNTAAINVCIPEVQDTDSLLNELSSIDGVNSVETHSAIYAEAVVEDFRDTDFDMNTMFYNINDIRNINSLEIREKSSNATGSTIWLPLYISNFGQFSLDDEIIYKVNSSKYTFTVAGVVEEMQYGNYGKGMIGVYLSDEAFNAFADDNADNKVVEYSLIIKNDATIEEIKTKVSDVLSDNDISMLSMCDSLSTKDTRTMVCSLLTLILISFACIILLVSVFLSKFRISNSIENEIVSMGVLKALGFTSHMIISCLVIPYMLVTLIGSMAGILLSYLILPALTSFLTMQSGFSFKLVFDIGGMVCAIIVPILIVLVFTVSAAKRIKKIKPINAIRGNSETRTATSNPLPLENTFFSTGLRLILKQMCTNKKQNVLLFFVSFVLTILVAFSGTLFYNVIIKPENFMSTLSEETPDIILFTEDDCQKELVDILQVDSRVKNVLQYSTNNVTINSSSVTAFVCEDFEQITNDLCYIGQNPKSANEIALGSEFQSKYHIGDNVTIESEGKSCTYEISGFIQSVNYQGKVCELTIDGYLALAGEITTPSLYVYLTKEASAKELINEYENSHSALIIKTINSQKMAQTSQEMYMSISAVIILVIFILTMLIVLFILYIIIRSLLARRMQELGIYKAIGYTSGQLMLQTAGSFLPVTITAVLLSSVLGMIYMPYINQVIFSSVGAMKNNLEVSFLFLMAFAIVLIALNFIISICLTLPIRKISSYSLIKE